MTKERDKQFKKLNNNLDVYSFVKDAINESHKTSSDETVKQFEDTKKEIDLIVSNHDKLMEKLDNFIDETRELHHGVKLELAELPKKLADEFDQRYASKDIERTIKNIGTFIVLGVLGALLALVIK